MRSLFAVLSAALLSVCAPVRAQIYSPPASMNLDPYYGKYIDAANGIPIVANLKVSDQALYQMKKVVETMLGRRADVAAAMRGNIRIIIIPAGDALTSIPEYSNLDQIWPLPNGLSWNDRARGLGWTANLPYQSCGEENLLHLASDRYVGESICVHEFAHAVYDLGVASVDSGFNDRLNRLYTNALNAGKLANSYQATNMREYSAEAAQAWYEANICKNPADGTHNGTCSNATLWWNDPDLWWELSYIFPRLATGDTLY